MCVKAIFYYRPISIQHQRHMHQYSPAHIMMHANSTATCSSASMPQPTLFNSVTSRLLSPRRTVSIKPLPLLPLSPPSSPPYKSPAIKSKIKAARTESTGVSLGFRAPHFELQEPLTGKVWTLDEFESYPALLVMFICNHCPFVIHLKKDIVKLANFYMSKGLAIVAISSNSTITHPQDGPEFMAEEAKLLKYPFPYLYDESQEVAKAFGAVCTPEFFLFKKDGRRPFELFYHGQFDDSRPSSNTRVTGRDLSLAIDRVLSGQEPPQIQKPSVGCSIKWHP